MKTKTKKTMENNDIIDMDEKTLELNQDKLQYRILKIQLN